MKYKTYVKKTRHNTDAYAQESARQARELSNDSRNDWRNLEPVGAERILTLSGMASFRRDLVTGEGWWSENLYRMLGMDSSEGTPPPGAFLEVVDLADRDRVARFSEGRDISFPSPAPEECVFRIQRADGSRRVVRVMRELEFDADGNPTTVTGVVQDITKTMETEGSLRIHEARLAAVAANLPGAIFEAVPGSQGRLNYTFVSEGIRKTHGVSPNEVYRNPSALERVVHPADRTMYRERIARVVGKQQAWMLDFRIVRPSGEIRRVRAVAQPHHRQDGGIVWYGMFLDKDDEMRMEQALRVSESRFRAIATNAPAAIAITRFDDGKIRFANRTFERTLGYEPGELAGANLCDLYVDPGDRASMLERLRNTGGVSNQEIPFRHRNGGTCWLLLSATCLDGFDGKEILGASIDITELRNARAALEERSYQLAERIKELDCLLTVSHLTADDSLSTEEICTKIVQALPAGWQFPEIARARLCLEGEEYGSTDLRQCRYRLQSQILNGVQKIGELELGYIEPRPEADDGPFLNEERTLLNSVALHIGQMVSRRDISARLAQSQKLEAIGQLTGGIAHDFNNLLTVLFGNLEMLQEHLRNVEDPETLLYLERSIGASEKAAELTNHLLAFSRRQTLRPQAINASEVIMGMFSLMDRTLGDPVSIRTHLVDDLPAVDVDRSQLETVILNLAINARDAMPHGGTLAVRTALSELDPTDARFSEETPPGRYVCISVADTGTGMDEDTLGRMFEPFYTTKEAGKGSGLGLSMVYGFIKQSGGHITVLSELGEGTTFRLYLPVATDVVPSALPPYDERLTTEPASGKECVLIVEDEPDVLAYLSQTLRVHGYEVLEAADANAALGIIRSGASIDLVLSDISLPGEMNGVEMADKARELAPGLRFLFTSGHAYDALVAGGILEEGVELLPKPFRSPDLLASVRQSLG